MANIMQIVFWFNFHEIEQDITLTNDDLVQWRLYASLGLNVLRR